MSKTNTECGWPEMELMVAWRIKSGTALKDQNNCASAIS